MFLDRIGLIGAAMSGFGVVVLACFSGGPLVWTKGCRWGFVFRGLCVSFGFWRVMFDADWNNELQIPGA